MKVKESPQFSTKACFYNEDGYSSIDLEKPSKKGKGKKIGSSLPLYPAEREGVTWLSFSGTLPDDWLQALGESYKIHPLSLEDAINPSQRPKTEHFAHYTLVTLKWTHLVDEEVITTHFSIILMDKFVLTFQEAAHDFFSDIRRRLQEEGSQTRKSPASYLVYKILDCLVDNDLRVSEILEEEVEELEGDLLEAQHAADIRSAGILPQVYRLRMKIRELRRSTRPLREVIKTLEEDENQFFDGLTKTYLRDVYDHTRWVSDSVENMREILNGMFELHMSRANNRMSEVMKVLAMISTIFIPLNLIAAIYGMNFKFMPETEIKGAYFITLLIMLVLAVGMLIFFKKKRWF